jgi:hypothetical protein
MVPNALKSSKMILLITDFLAIFFRKFAKNLMALNFPNAGPNKYARLDKTNIC